VGSPPFSRSLIASVLISGLASIACSPGGPLVPGPYFIKYDLIQMVDQAQVTMPPVATIENIRFETGSWQFDRDGYVHLTRLSADRNRLRFEPRLEGAPDGEVVFRYRTRWTQTDEQLLTVFFGESRSPGPAVRYGVSLGSDGTIAVERQQVDEDLRSATRSVLVRARSEETNEIWRTYRIEVRSSRVRMTVGDEVLVDALLPDGRHGEPTVDGSWGVELERRAGGGHRTQAVLGGLFHQRFSAGGEVVSSAFLAPKRRPARGEVQLLNMVYSPDQEYLPPALAYLVKTAHRRISKEGREIVPGLFAPPGSAYRYRLSAAPGDVLRAHYGFDLGRAGDDAEALTFYAELVAEGRSQRLFEKTISLEAQKQRGDLFELDLPLPVTDEAPIEVVLGVSKPEGIVPSSETNLGERGLSIWAAPLVAAPSSGEVRPNVILISIDTLRPDFLGPFNRDAETFTPNLTAFGRSAVKFTDAFTVSPWTLPAHFSLFTGRYPSRHGLNRAFGQNRKLAARSVTTLADVLRGHGYFTAAIASDHSLNPDYGVDKGFLSFVDETVRDAAPLIPVFQKFIESHRQRQFFLFFHSYDLHAPLFHDDEDDSTPAHEEISYRTFLNAKPTEVERERVRRLYRNHAREYDTRFGEIVSTLKQHGLLDSSIIVVTADHGEELFEHGNYLHGHSLYDEVLRVPLLVKFPSSSAFPETNGSLTALIDVMPSLLEFLGIAVPPDLDGRSFMPVLAGRAREQRRYFFAEALAWGPERKAIRTREYKYILTRPGVPEYEPRAAAYDSLFDTREGEELYRIAEDRQELHNGIRDRPDLAATFRKVTDPLWEVERREGSAVELDSSQLDALRTLGYVRD
jgi:arylsulfatase A-like enzyme